MASVGTARLTDRITAERAVAASISRQEIRDVLHDADATPELTLDVVAEDGSREQRTVSMTWSRDDLEKLLEGASGDDVVLTFDRNELAAALDDVEAHGLRTRAAVFAVAAVGALGSTAAVAYAAPVSTGGPAMSQSQSSSVASDAMVTDASTGGGYAAPSQSDAAALAALQARSEAMDAQLATGSASSDRMVTDASTSGNAAPSQSDAAALAALQARSEAMDAQLATGSASSDRMVTDASSGGYATPGTSAEAAALQARSQALDEQYGLTAADQSATSALIARGAAMNEQYGLGDSGATGIVTDASTGGGYATPTATGGDGGFAIQAPSTDEALLTGAALLVIAGAGFAARRSGSLRRA